MPQEHPVHKKKHKHILLTTGGTGGHIFPASATASELTKAGYKLNLFTDTHGQKWNGILDDIPAYNVPSSSVLGRGITGKIKAVIKIVYGFFIARKHFKTIKYDCVIGFGGYASVPVILAAASLSKIIILHEQNAFAGRANRLLACFATVIATAFPKPHGLESNKCIQVGNPVRPKIKLLDKNKYHQPKDIVNILITGGSQGAEIFGDVIPKALAKYKGKINVTQQARKEQVEEIKKNYESNGIKATVSPFIKDMAYALKSAHIAISRSGAGSVMENAVAGIPTIFVPYKYSADNHQYYNACAIVKSGGGMLIEQDNFSIETLQNMLDSFILKSDKSALSVMSDLAKDFSIPDADINFSKLIIKTLNK